MARCARASCGRDDESRVAADVAGIRRKGKGGAAVPRTALDSAVPSRYGRGFVPTPTRTSPAPSTSVPTPSVLSAASVVSGLTRARDQAWEDGVIRKPGRDA
jgi:hypothetical protein